MESRSDQLQIRVTPREKSALKRRARAAGMDVSAYVLALAFPKDVEPFADIIDALHDEGRRRFALAELSDRLTRLAPLEFAASTDSIDVRELEPLWQNYVAAMVEVAARTHGARAPQWTGEVPALDKPHFATSLMSLRSYLLRVSPVAFKRRNIFVDATVGERV